MVDASELESYKVQLQQVDAALLAEPENEELLKLKHDLSEVIDLTVELLGGAGGSKANDEDDATGSSSAQDGNRPQKVYTWKVGDRCKAPTETGTQYEAIIEGLSQGKASVAFVGTGRKNLVDLTELVYIPVPKKKNYAFDIKKDKKKGADWKLEKERKRAKAIKKLEKRKALEEAKETEKKQWHQFTAKGAHKHLKGFKKLPSAAVNTGNFSSSKIGERRQAVDNSKFQSTRRGNMDSLF